MRRTTIERETRETFIQLDLNLDGNGDIKIRTGWGLADHMLTLIAFWSGWDLDLQCRGDLHVDAHHTLEDIGLCLGQAFRDAVSDPTRIHRLGTARVPMDEALTDVVVDVSGRPYLVYQDDLLPPMIGGEESDVWREFFKSFAFKAQLNLHIRFLYGQNGHHLLESACKGTGVALAQGVSLQGQGVRSTKGSLD
ncbi:imidazoleglycerol-phosphate dehydratase HisB [Desulfohalobium retbaense]|uniref:Imidazoleglycerol-phosphate dehydratase n=1 Tax=Desulfohalobium retbaense (strain ATCC 49708 / DSM 5692 / JCM 16813 / HR100) TaxID=485915 RepID=C8X1I3_DESRD|nr:imidazoleglycerol-phosphate dehydratase HisB [Desulfohalobium retbaense]ACV68280.1 Imidazoleglycerol-phosphate dehydratase [Desulfohalobium retbaense DSM 5692]